MYDVSELAKPFYLTARYQNDHRDCMQDWSDKKHLFKSIKQVTPGDLIVVTSPFTPSGNARS